MDKVELRRSHVAFSISQNPATVIVRSEEKVDAGGYFKTEKNEFEITVRIFQKEAPSVTIDSKEVGSRETAKHYGMLAHHGAPFKISKDVYYRFSHHGLSFVIKSITPQIILNQLVGYQCELERVS